jgi:toxin ParE1/3/4
MPYDLRRLPQAEAENEAAAIWYENRKPTLGFASLARIDEAVAHIARNPLRYSIRFGDVRRAPVARFKNYGVYYFVQGAEIVIISIFNDRRDPTLLKTRREGTNAPA